jgi:hypothetical protein
MCKRVLILVLTVDQEPWRTIEVQGQRATWAAITDEEPSIFWLHGRTGGVMRFLVRACGKAIQMSGSERTLARYRQVTGSWAAGRPVSQESDMVLTGVPETYLNTNPKTIAGLRHMLDNYAFDYLFRTNTSTYVNRQLLANFVEELPVRRYYGGFIGESNGIRYASGTCTLLSRDAVEVIVADPQWEYNVIDDVAIGRSMRRAGIEIQPLRRVDLTTSALVDHLDTRALRSTFVVRCKGNESREHDVASMRHVHELYRAAGLA